MAEINISLPVWNKAPITIRAVQGEAKSRIIAATLIDAGGQPVDLTGASVRLYVVKPDHTVNFMDGTISDAINGACNFTLESGIDAAVGIADCQILVSWPDNRSLKVVGLALEILPSDLDGALESTSEYSALVTALNKADTAATTATQAAASAQKAVSDAQSAVSTANQASATATTAAQTANTAADRANTAAGDTEKMYQMVDPTTGKMDYVTNIIKNLEAYIFSGAITAGQLDGLNLTATAFDGKNITARDFDTSAKTILGVA